jgi:putative ABC transport system permease protein
MTATLPRSRLRAGDTVRTSVGSLRSRFWRAALSALGIAIGIAAGVAVLGVSSSSRAALLAELGAEGNLLTVSAGTDFTGSPAPLPVTAIGMVARIPPVQSVCAVGYVPNATVRRTAAVPAVVLGAVAVLVGAVGVANIMVISVLERRTEIGLRRALEATKRQVGMQFLTESVLLSALGGVGGVVLGAAATATYALVNGQSVAVPLAAIGGGVAVAIAVGLLAGVYPAVRPAQLPPTEALRAA